jgi:thiamine-monophosphate kinase
MKLSQVGEFGIIEKIRRTAAVGRGVRLGIGDDAAWLQNFTSSCLVTADLLLENVHFNLKWTSLFDLGYKSLAVNISDIAAMGGVPAYAITSLGLPAAFGAEQVYEFYRGMNALARESAVSIVGGDTSVAESLLVSVCILGHAPYHPVSRGGARAGDDIYVTGTVGDAALGLELLKRKSPALSRAEAAYLLKRHHRPTPRTGAGVLLARSRLAAAMIDVSDGLLQDLGHVCKASGVGAVICEESLPRSSGYRALAEDSRWALCGGEDYELLFCARRRVRAAIERLSKQAGVRITRIGACVRRAEGINVLDRRGRKVKMPALGYDHFRAAHTGAARSRNRPIN